MFPILLFFLQQIEGMGFDYIFLQQIKGLGFDYFSTKN